MLLLEADCIGGASGRNGGHLNNALAHSFIAAKKALGTERAIALYRAFDQSTDTPEALIAEEGIDCSFRRAGKLKLASKPVRFDAIARNFEAMHREVDPDTALLTGDELKGELGSPFYGVMLSRKSAMMHTGRFVTGLADAAMRHGAVLVENAPVGAIARSGQRHALATPRGTVKEVLVVTGAYSTPNFRHLPRRIISVGSFIISTCPPSDGEIASVVPGIRTQVTSMNIGNYFRLLPDRRLIFGGRARFSASSDQQSAARSGAILRTGLG